MEKNLNITNGIFFSQRVLLELTNSGYTREEAYKIVQANDLIKDYMERQPNHYFISTRSQFINNYGRPIGKYFVKDSLHLSKAGYNLWREIIKNELENNLN